VVDMVISEVHGRKLVFSIHEDCVLRVWNLSNRTRLLFLNLTLYQSQGNFPSLFYLYNII
jgi:Nucleoporin Nup120/160